MMEESPERKKSKHEFQFEKCLCCPERTGIAIPYVYTHSMLQDVLAMTVPRKDKKKSAFLLMSACVCCDRIKTNDAIETLEAVAGDLKRRTGFKTSTAFLGCFWNVKYAFSAQFLTVPLLQMLF